MTLQFLLAEIDNPPCPVSQTRSPDHGAISILFDALRVRSDGSDADAAPQTQRQELILRCEGEAWVQVDVRGISLSSGPHGYAHAMAWVNGRRFTLAPHAPNEPFVASLAVRPRDGTLRISLLLLAQRDLLEPHSQAECWVDSIDASVIQSKARS